MGGFPELSTPCIFPARIFRDLSAPPAAPACVRPSKYCPLPPLPRCPVPALCHFNEWSLPFSEDLLREHMFGAHVFAEAVCAVSVDDDSCVLGFGM